MEKTKGGEMSSICPKYESDIVKVIIHDSNSKQLEEKYRLEGLICQREHEQKMLNNRPLSLAIQMER